jgi:allantoinase
MADRARLAVVGGDIVSEAGVFAATVLVGEDGTIAGLLAPGERVTADEVIDAAGLLVFPGGVDAHVHLNDPGLTESEDFYTGTAGAAAGGATTVLEMPQTAPLVDSPATFRDKLEAVAPKAVVDFGLWSALVPGNSDDPGQLGAVVAAGAVALKAFFCETPEMPRVNGSQLARGLRHARRLGVPVAVHSESQAVIDLETDRLRGRGVHDVQTVALSRPPEAERAAVLEVLELARASGGRLHLVHISDPATVDAIVAARRSGVDVSIETCPHYLTLSRDELTRSGVWAVCQPPLNAEDAVEGLWEALRLDLIDTIGSDHCAYTWEQKNPADRWHVAPGINGLQVSLPVLLDGALRRGVPLATVARVFSANPARRFSLAPRKGAVLPGADADLVLVDLRRTTEVAAGALFTRCPGTVYDGMSFAGRVVRTMVRGTTVYVDDGRPRIEVEPGFGRFLRPASAIDSGEPRLPRTA